MSLAGRGTRIFPCLARRCVSRPAVLVQAGAGARALLQQYSSQAVPPSQVEPKEHTGLVDSSGLDSETGPGAAADSQLPSSKPSKISLWKRETRTSTFADLTVKKSTLLRRRSGIAKFLRLQELSHPPGMEFDLKTLSLSVHERFPQQLQYVWDVQHHLCKPWIRKAFLQRAEAWHSLDVYDLGRSNSTGDPKTKNSTRKRHMGATRGHPTTFFSLAIASQKAQGTYSFERSPALLGPRLPPRMLCHLDGMETGDVQVYTENYCLSGKLSCVWVAINAPMRTAARNWEALARGEAPHPDEDTLAPILENLGQWLKEAHRDSRRRKPVNPEDEDAATRVPMQDARGPEDKAPKARRTSPPPDAVPTVVPVILAWRQKYIWFLWTGGVDGKLVAQYASHWLPLDEVDKRDMDVRIRFSQDAWRRRYQSIKLDGEVGLDEFLNPIPQLVSRVPS